MNHRQISVYGDGSSGGDSKHGCGWGWLVIDHTNDTVLGMGSGGLQTGTNNYGELKALIEGLKFVVEKELFFGNLVTLVSDSKYALGLASGEFNPVKNQELAQEIRGLVIQTRSRTMWIKGHSGDPYNTKCDALAKAGRDLVSPNKGTRKRQKRITERERKRAIKKTLKEAGKQPTPMVESPNGQT